MSTSARPTSAELILRKSICFGQPYTNANLSEATLRLAELSRAGFTGANLSGADLAGTDLSEANFSEANLSGARVTFAILRRTSLYQVVCTGAIFNETVFSDVDLSSCKGLESCVHRGPSPLDIRTLQRSGELPIPFLRGVGLPDTLIEYLPSLLRQSIQHYSCFISYSTKDTLFATRLHADLQNKGVRSWFAPHDLPIGAKTWDTIDEAIRLRDKLLLILSKAAIVSEWVEDEVNRAYSGERERKTKVLIPMRLDTNVMTTMEPWARKLRDQRNIGDFRRWRNPDAYHQAFDRLVRNLQVEGP
jgi:uncharacterized protein YjbI with pentapeptide repeats